MVYRNPQQQFFQEAAEARATGRVLFEGPALVLELMSDPKSES